MKWRLVLILGLTLSLGACGVKSDLMLPDGKSTPKGEHDPSKPPQPNGQ